MELSVKISGAKSHGELARPLVSLTGRRWGQTGPSPITKCLWGRGEGPTSADSA